ncbi:hypothetical protein, partial [Actinoallomurus oryzae]|uniref:hypothetical protein n=1 Tax=Actinoallomurus oryzae TaxID=502180 RepID=UPI0031E58ABC
MTTTGINPHDDDPRIGSVDIDTWHAIPAPKDAAPEERLGGYCIVAGDCDEADVWIEVTAEHPKDVAEFIVQAVRNEYASQPRLTNGRTRIAPQITTRALEFGNLRDAMADAILAATYPPEEWPDGPPGEGEMNTAREQADAALAVRWPQA